MNSENNDKITAFDSLFTTNHMRICKILMPHMSCRMQHFFALYIKLYELTYTYSFFSKNPPPNVEYGCENNIERSSCKESDGNKQSDFANICREIMPYSTESEKEKLSRITSMFEQMKNMQEMMEMAELFKDMMPEGEEGFDPETFSQIFSMMQGTDT
jgi:hypothetical protein